MNLLDLLFPKACLECGSDGKYICNICLGKVLDYGRVGNDYSIFKYQGVIRKAIISLKYKFATDITQELAEAVLERFKMYDLGFKNVTLVPIPLHKKRENFRGFNQAELIGKELAGKKRWEFIPDLLNRNKNTVPQVGLKGLSRRSNLSGVFSVNPKHSSPFAVHGSLVLFDDVYTTGSTINEAKKVLENIGFKKIYSLTIAR